MKKKILLLACCGILLASCSSDDNNNILRQQAQIDSATKVNLAKQEVINQRRNDSTINAIAMAKADSITKAQEMGKANEKPGMKNAPKAPLPVMETNTASPATK